MLTMFFALGSVRDIFRPQVEARKHMYAVSTGTRIRSLPVRLKTA
jgi:hypothetical protein